MSVPFIIHGSRQVKSSMVDSFKQAYHAFANSQFTRNDGHNVKAIFAFPDPGVPTLYYHMLWSHSSGIGSGSAESVNVTPHSCAELQSAYASSADDPDTLNVYGGWTDGMKTALSSNGSNVGVRYIFHDTMAGYIKSTGDGQEGPPLIGFFRRAVKPGCMDALASSFQKVCDIWHTKPGILCALVCRDQVEENVVHDLRIFANPAAYAAHVDKSDTVLTAAMEAWFENYDTSVPFTGEMYAADTSDPATRTNSLNTSGPKMRAEFARFHYGEEDGMLGPMPDMTKNDIISNA